MLAAFYLALTPEGSEASITQTWMGQVSVIDLSSIQVADSIDVIAPSLPWHLAFTSTGTFARVATESCYAQVIAD